MGFWLAIALSSLVLTGCSMETAEISSARPADVRVAERQTGQQLPVEARMQVGDRQIDLEVARTPQQQAMGLMYRDRLDDDRGMLFPFDAPQPVRFWMKNVRIPLDMIFLRGREVVGISADVPPCQSPARLCPTYSPGDDVLVDRVIELRGGRTAELGIEVGDRLDIQEFDASTADSSAE